MRLGQKVTTSHCDSESDHAPSIAKITRRFISGHMVKSSGTSRRRVLHRSENTVYTPASFSRYRKFSSILQVSQRMLQHQCNVCCNIASKIDQDEHSTHGRSGRPTRGQPYAGQSPALYTSQEPRALPSTLAKSPAPYPLVALSQTAV